MTSDASNHSEEHGHDDHHGPDGHHVMSLPMMFGIFGALIFFTALTVAIGQFSLGRWEILITMMIATTKATLVALFFMHLLYDRPFNAMMFSFSLFFVALFLGIVLMDRGAYSEDLVPPVRAEAAPAAPAEPAPKPAA
ncbi:MAG: cytochrome C oxidase subunit IV family protein [Fuerstiella sp.]